jgi:hypothetical protein
MMKVCIHFFFSFCFDSNIYIVPIFDGREHDFNFDDDLQNISDLLPLYESEVPFGSCALVAHTMTSYKKEEKNHLSLNVQWVVILGTTE